MELEQFFIHTVQGSTLTATRSEARQTRCACLLSTCSYSFKITWTHLSKVALSSKCFNQQYFMDRKALMYGHLHGHITYNPRLKKCKH